MAFISVLIFFFWSFIEWADLICLSGAGQPKFFLLLFVIKSVHCNSFSRPRKRAKVGEKSEKEFHYWNFNTR